MRREADFDQFLTDVVVFHQVINQLGHRFTLRRAVAEANEIKIVPIWKIIPTKLCIKIKYNRNNKKSTTILKVQNTFQLEAIQITLVYFYFRCNITDDDDFQGYLPAKCFFLAVSSQTPIEMNVDVRLGDLHRTHWAGH